MDEKEIREYFQKTEQEVTKLPLATRVHGLNFFRFVNDESKVEFQAVDQIKKYLVSQQYLEAARLSRDTDLFYGLVIGARNCNSLQDCICETVKKANLTPEAFFKVYYYLSAVDLMLNNQDPMQFIKYIVTQRMQKPFAEVIAQDLKSSLGFIRDQLTMQYLGVAKGVPHLYTILCEKIPDLEPSQAQLKNLHK